MKTSPAPIMRMVYTPEPADCTVIALMHWIGCSYGEAVMAIGDPLVAHDGAWFARLRPAAAALGVRTRLKRRPNLDEHEEDGIVRVDLPNGDRHVVVLRADLVWDATKRGWEAWDPADYLKVNRARFGSILVRADD